MFFNILIFGCGNIGSRHIQGLLKNEKIKIRIYVVEKNKNSIRIAKNRISNYKNNNLIFFYKNLDFKKKKFDLCILATTSKNRLLYIRQIIKNKIIKNLIIEKVPFQNLEDFKKAKNILEKKNITSFVNFPRRSYSVYKNLKNKINSDILVRIQVVGNPWNMASNMLHFIDLLMFFSKSFGEKLNFKLGKNNKIIKSKRKNFNEIKGRINVYNSEGRILDFRDTKNMEKELVIKIFNGNNIFEINETKFTLKINNRFICNFNYPYQSYLSKFYPSQLTKYKNLNLTELSKSYLSHKLLFNILNIQFNKIYKKNILSFPIS